MFNVDKNMDGHAPAQKFIPGLVVQVGPHIPNQDLIEHFEDHADQFYKDKEERYRASLGAFQGALYDLRVMTDNVSAKASSVVNNMATSVTNTLADLAHPVEKIVVEESAEIHVEQEITLEFEPVAEVESPTTPTTPTTPELPDFYTPSTSLTTSSSGNTFKLSSSFTKVNCLQTSKMCLPCFGYSDIYLEEEKKMKREKKPEGVTVWEPVSKSWVKITGGAIPLQYVSQPAMQYPAGPPAFIQPPAPVHVPNMTYSQYQNQNPYYGMTGSEVLSQQLNFAEHSNINAKQEMKPADDNPGRYYWVRELDDTWTQRNRFTIDSGDIGECRWYVDMGRWYAIRLPES